MARAVYEASKAECDADPLAAFELPSEACA